MKVLLIGRFSGGERTGMIARLVADLPTDMDKYVEKLGDERTAYLHELTIDLASVVAVDDQKHLEKLTLDFRSKESLYSGLLNAIVTAVAIRSSDCGWRNGQKEGMELGRKLYAPIF